VLHTVIPQNSAIFPTNTGSRPIRSKIGRPLPMDHTKMARVNSADAELPSPAPQSRTSLPACESSPHRQICGLPPRVVPVLQFSTGISRPTSNSIQYTVQLALPGAPGPGRVHLCGFLLVITHHAAGRRPARPRVPVVKCRPGHRESEKQADGQAKPCRGPHQPSPRPIRHHSWYTRAGKALSVSV